MMILARRPIRTGPSLHNPVLTAEGKGTPLTACLAGAVLVGLVLNAHFGRWWAAPLGGTVMLYYAAREAHHALKNTSEGTL